MQSSKNNFVLKVFSIINWQKCTGLLFDHPVLPWCLEYFLCMTLLLHGTFIFCYCTFCIVLSYNVIVLLDLTRIFYWCNLCTLCQYVHCESKNKIPNSCSYLRQLLVVFLKNTFTVTLKKFAMNRSLQIPPHLKDDATLPCEILVYKNRSIFGEVIDKSLASCFLTHSVEIIVCSNIILIIELRAVFLGMLSWGITLQTRGCVRPNVYVES